MIFYNNNRLYPEDQRMLWGEKMDILFQLRQLRVKKYKEFNDE